MIYEYLFPSISVAKVTVLRHVVNTMERILREVKGKVMEQGPMMVHGGKERER